MLSRVTRASLVATAVGAITVLAAGCAGGSSSAGSHAVVAKPAPMSPQKAIELAVKKTTTVNTLAATFSIHATAQSQSVDATGSFQEQIHPSVLFEAKFGNMTANGQSVPGGLGEIVTPKAVYLRLSAITESLHTTKPWVKIPLSSAGSIGSTISSLLNEVQSSSPVTQTQMLTGAKDVRKVGTGVIGGVPVTEYAGAVPFSQAIAHLPANVRSQIASQVSSSGIKSVDFKIWLDAQQLPRKVVVTEDGTTQTETITETITSYNEPVSIKLPTAGETYVIPSSQLKS